MSIAASSSIRSVAELSHATRLQLDAYLDGLVQQWRGAVHASDAKRRENGDPLAGQRAKQRNRRGEA